MGITFSRTNRVITTRSQLDEDINNLFLNNESPQTLSTNLIDQQRDDQLISSFLEVAVGQTVETAKTFLETTNWNIDESINLFLLRNTYEPSVEDHAAEQSNESTTFDGGESDSTLASMYRPPVHMLFEGRTFEEAKSTSCTQNLWLLVNLQSRTEFASHALNRDLWSNDTVSEAVMCSFVLWQVYDNTIEGKKILNFYKIDSAPPVVLVIDPVTGQKMGMWSGVVDAQSFVEDLSRFLEAGPHEHVASLIRDRYPETEDDQTCSASNNNDQVPVPSWGEEFEKEDDWSSSKGPSWGEEFENVVETCSSSNNDDGIFELPDLTEEPTVDCDKSLVCSLCVRFPDGRRKQRKFLKTEHIQLLWSFCHSQMVDSEKKTFKLVQAIPGASKTLDYGLYATFEESGLANSMISVLYN